MKVALRLDKITEQWQLEVLEGAHNHEASADPSAYPAYRIAALVLGATLSLGNFLVALRHLP
jgi:hypothetical protein